LKYDVIVIGGGAAGLMCAIEAGKRGRSVAVLEHNERLGKKILISGGGRCNFTNLHAAPENYVSSNPHFCKSALARYTPSDFLALIERHRIAWHQKKLGQLFCNISSREIVAMLQQECEIARVRILLGCHVREVRKPDRFELATEQGTLVADALVVATGGLSFPKMGASDLGYSLARQFGLKLVEARPGLVPLTFSKPDREFFADLSGVSIDALVYGGGECFRENLLFTHRGLSGPAILQISNYCRDGETIHIDLLPEQSALDLFNSTRGQSRELVTVLSERMPRRFVQSWCARFAPSQAMNRYSTRQLEDIARDLHNWELRPTGNEGYAKAEVTLGGVDTGELSSKSMESRAVPGLFFIGEVVDVTGWLGGYNFQWAWASGFAAGQRV
jgi:predicted Rossmann fold flavoprotein